MAIVVIRTHWHFMIDMSPSYKLVTRRYDHVLRTV